MLPQKFGLDVVVKRDTHELVLIEVNGENSGFKGIMALDEEATPKDHRCNRFDWIERPSSRFPKLMIEEMLRIADRGRILINPNNLVNPSSNSYGALGTLFKEAGVQVFFTYNIGMRLRAEDLEDMLSAPLDTFDVIAGLGDFLTRCDRHEDRMINAATVEKFTGDKALQYHLLKDKVLVPETQLFYPIFSFDQLYEFRRKHGRVLAKMVDGSLGRGICFLDDGFEERTSSLFEEYREVTLQFLKSWGYEGEWDPDSLKRFFAEKSSSSKDRDELVFGPTSRINLMLQQFIETEPVIHPKTGNPHYAKARLIWFNGYKGGYWALSKKPIDSDQQSNLIVNYTNNGNARAFSEEEEKMFREYAERVCPVITATIEPFIGNRKDIDKIHHGINKEAMVRASI